MSRVVLPEPLGPNRIKVSPASTFRSMPLSTGVPWTETLLDPANPGAPHLALALKSGNFGGEDFFMQALGLLANAN